MQFIEIDDKIKADKIRNMMSAKQKNLLYRLETEIFDDMTCDWIDVMLSQKPRLVIDNISSNSNGIFLSTPYPATTYYTTRSCNC